MGTGYTRNDSSNNIANGNAVNANDLDGEFDAIESAMSTSGHTHDGTSAEGGPVSVVGPAQDLVVTASEVKPKTTNTLDLGTASLQFKDAHFDGTVDTDALVAGTADINGGTVDGVTIGGASAGDVTFANLSDGAITVTAFVDEDDMSSNSATLLPTQQSVKAYADSGTQTLTNKTIDVDSNTLSNIEVDNFKSGVLDTDISSVASDDTTLASAKAIKTYVDSQVTAQDLDFQGDSGGALSIDLDSETLDIAGGTGIDTSGSGNTLTVGIDSTVATLSGAQTLTNKSIDTSLTFGDDDKAIFGAGSDLQIYHDGSNSYIKDSGTGNLRINADDFTLTNAANNSNLISTFNGEVYLYNNSNIKLLTTSTGIDVTGTVTADGLTVDGTSTLSSLVTLTGGAPRIEIYESDSTDVNARIDSSGSALNLKTIADDGGSQKTRIKIAHATGDISFYEDTGSSAKFFWDASAESLELGGTLLLDDGVNRMTLDSISGANRLMSTTTGFAAYEDLEFRADKYLFKIGSSERMRIDPNGNLLVGKTAFDATTTGSILSNNGELWLTRSGATPAYIRRLSSDGTLLQFNKDGSTVGSIGVADVGNAPFLYVGFGDTGFSFQGHTNDSITPVNTAGTNRDAAIDLGGDGSRFKDLYLSGGVYLGGTGSANHLDDVEEGTWNPQLQFGGATTGISYDGGLVDGWYQKVNKMVMITARFKLSSKGTATGSARITGLPFATALSTMNGYLNRPCLIKITGGINGPFWVGVKTDGNSYIDLYSSGDGSAVTNAHFQNGTYLTFEMTHDTAN